jgi:hypothetical protein
MERGDKKSGNTGPEVVVGGHDNAASVAARNRLAGQYEPLQGSYEAAGWLSAYAGQGRAAEVRYVADATGPHGLTVTYAQPDTLPGSVFPAVNVSVTVWIVRDDLGIIAARDAAEIPGLLVDANKILWQSGLMLVQNGTLRYLDNDTWLNHTVVFAETNVVMDAMMDSTNSMGNAVELYFVQTLDGENGTFRCSLPEGDRDRRRCGQQNHRARGASRLRSGGHLHRGRPRESSFRPGHWAEHSRRLGRGQLSAGTDAADNQGGNPFLPNMLGRGRGRPRSQPCAVLSSETHDLRASRRPTDCLLNVFGH